MSGLSKRITKLETRSADGPQQFMVLRSIVSRAADGSLIERLSTIRGFGKLLSRKGDETDQEFIARAKIELKE